MCIRDREYKDKTVRVVKKGKEWNISKDRVKPFFGEGGPQRSGEVRRPVQYYVQLPGRGAASSGTPEPREEPVMEPIPSPATEDAPIELRECSVPLTPVQIPEERTISVRTRSGREVRPPNRFSP